MSAAAASADIRCVKTPINAPSCSPEPNIRGIVEKIGTPGCWDTRICDYKEPSLPAQPDKEPSLPAPTPAPEPTPAPAVDHNDPHWRDKWEYVLLQQALALKPNLVVFEQPKDCKCLFHCWAFHLRDDTVNADGLRTAACDEIERCKADFAPFFRNG